MNELTSEQMAILFEAWAIHSRGMGLVIQPEELPDAHKLKEQGWLEMRIDDVCMSWWWTQQAEVALTSGALINAEQDPGRRN